MKRHFRRHLLEEVIGDDKRKTDPQHLWRHSGYSTPSKGVRKMRENPTPFEGVSAEGKRRTPLSMERLRAKGKKTAESIPESGELPLVVPPVGVDLDIELQEDFLLEEVLHVDAGLGADALQRCSPGADDDALLGFAHDVDDGADVVAVRIFLELLYHYLSTIGYLLVVVGQDLLADNLGGKEAEVAVGEEILVVPGLALRQQADDAVEYGLEAETLLGRGGEYLGAGNCGGPLCGQSGHCLLVTQVYLVDNDEHRAVHTAQPVDVLPVLVSLLDHIGDVQDDVGVSDGGIHVLHHGALQVVGRLEDPRSVGVDYLVVLPVDYAHYPVTGGLGLGCDDRKALPDEGVHQRGLAHVGVAYDVDETGAVGDWITHRN